MKKLTLFTTGIVILLAVGWLLADNQAQAPDTEPATGWQTHTDEASGSTFSYPPTPDSEYIEFVDWPPQIGLADEPFSCSEVGEVTARSGETTSRTIDGQEYCVTVQDEGAAGSTYHQYTYRTEQDGETLSLTFSTRQPQCGNYPEGQRAECEREQEIDIDGLVEGIMQTLE